MSLLDLLRRWLGCDECRRLLCELRGVVQAIEARGSVDEDDETIAAIRASVDEYLARTW